MKYQLLAAENGDLLRFFGRFTRPRAKLLLTVENNELALGEELKGYVGVKSEEEFVIEGILVGLRCDERIKKTVGYRRTNEEDEDEYWEKEEGWDYRRLYSENFPVRGCEQMHAYVGLDVEFPFAIRIPEIGRETYHSVDKHLYWLLMATMYIKGRGRINAQPCQILVTKPSKTLLKETIREVVLIPCAYCGGLMPQTSTFCPNCGARRKT